MANRLKKYTYVFFLVLSSFTQVAMGGNKESERQASSFLFSGRDVVALCEQENAKSEQPLENSCAIYFMGVFHGHAGTIATQSEIGLAAQRDVSVESVRIAADMDEAVHAQLNQGMRSRAVFCLSETDEITNLIPSIVHQLKKDGELLEGRAYYSVIRVLHSLLPCPN